MDGRASQGRRIVRREGIHTKGCYALSHEVLSSFHADAGPVRNVRQVVRTQLPMRRPSEVEWHDIVSLNRSMTFFPVDDEALGHGFTLPEIAAVKSHATAYEAGKRNAIDGDVRGGVSVADEVRGCIHVGAIVFIHDNLVRERPISVPVRVPEVMVEPGVGGIVGNVLFKRLA